MRAKHPGIVIVIKDALAERTLSLIRADEADLAVTSAPPPDPQLQFTPLLKDRMVAVLPPGHPLANAKTVRLGRPARLAARTHGPRQQRAADRRRRLRVDRSAGGARLRSGLHGHRHRPRRAPGSAPRCCRHRHRSFARPAISSIRDLDAPRIERELGIVKQRRRSYSPAAEALVEVLQAVARDNTGKPARRRSSARDQ